MRIVATLAWSVSTVSLACALSSCSSTSPSTASFTGAPPRTHAATDDLSYAAEISSSAGSTDSLLAKPQEPAEPAPAANYSNMYRRAGLSAGAAFYGNFDTTMRVDGEEGVGAVIDLEDLLGLDDDNLIARIDAF